MRKIVLTLALLFTISIAFTSCGDEKKTSDEKIEAAINEVKEDLKASEERLSDDVEDALEDVQAEINEVKEEAN